jgi:hypothetical protein
MKIPQNMGPNEHYNIVSPLRTRANEKNWKNNKILHSPKIEAW